MKTLLVLGLFAFNSMAATHYSCPVRYSNIKLTLDGENSKVSVTEPQTNQYIDYGMLKDKIESNAQTDLMFEMETTRNFLQFRFKSEALKEEPERLFGIARGSVGHQIVDASVKCFKLAGPFNN
jgi:hypothetical protein